MAYDIVIWFWIGSYDNYERLIRELRKDVVGRVTARQRIEGGEGKSRGLLTELLRVRRHFRLEPVG